MSRILNTRRKQGFFIFRRKVPKRLRKTLNLVEVVRSLKTTSRPVARMRADQLWIATESYFKMYESDGTEDESGDERAPIRREELKRFLDHITQDFPFNYEFSCASGSFKVLNPGMLAPEGLEQVARLNRADLLEEPSYLILRTIAPICKELGIATEEGSVSETMLARTYTRALADFFEAEAQRQRKLRGETPQTRSGDVSPSLDVPSMDVLHGTVLFNLVWEKFESEQISNAKWTKPVARQSRSSAKLFAAICGDKPLSLYTPADGTLLRRTLLGLPFDYSKNPQFRETYLKDGPLQLVENTAANDEIKRLSKKTWNRHLSAFSGFWEFSQTEAFVALNKPSIFEKLHIKIPKGKKSPTLVFEERPIWSNKFMRGVFSSNLFLGCAARNGWRKKGPFVFRDERYWGVLIGPHQGLRREELFQLQVKHVCFHPKTKIWFIDLFSDGLRLKDGGSPRFVPLHHNILELGFIEARIKGRAPEAYLFPEAKPSSSDKKRGDYFGKFFHEFRWDVIDHLDELLPHVGDIDDEDDDNGTIYEDMVYHAARHTVATFLYRKKVSISHCEEFIGHESDERRSEFSRYNKGQTLRVLKKLVDKIVLPIDLEAHKEAVRRSEAIDRETAWPKLD